ETSPQTFFSSDSNRTRAHQVLFAVLLTIVVTSLLGDALLIVLTHRDRRLHTPVCFLLSQLSLVDVVLLFTTVPTMAAGYLAGHQAVPLAIFFLLTLGGGERFLLAAVACDRCVTVCHPLRYPVLTSWQLCLRMAVPRWLPGAADGLLQAAAALSFPHRRAHQIDRIDHFFCEAPVLLRLACADSSAFENAMYIRCVLTLRVPFASPSPPTASSLLPLSARAPRKPAGSLSAIFTYMRPKSHRSTHHDKVVSAFYTVFTPSLNPLIYGARNSEVKEAWKRWLGSCVNLEHHK
uniref:G-protein coupled receptors family 1 profile domain-containing protein n=1 Tax=Saimiri boliviensis boliviensis TaxID=39432 RepID=A0A2K6TIY4_SAIBB